MLFPDKLDFLMNITKTTNSTLARSVALDPSHISRLRRGERRLPKEQSFIEPMAEFFVRNAKAVYQRKAIVDALKADGASLEDEKDLMSILTQWLGEGEAASTGAATFLDNLSRFRFREAPPYMADGSASVRAGSHPVFYYGIEGKREAVLAFLSLVAREKHPQTLLLFSDEDMRWLFDSPAFTGKWASMLSEVIGKGNRIRIIHTVSRNIDEMLGALSQWLPIYMTGAIEPYYYPRIRDGIYRRTLFVAPGTAAITSNSVQSKTDSMLNLLITDVDAVSALAREFEDYIALCRPLMQIFTARSKSAYWKILAEFENEKADAIVRSPSPSFMTMPREVWEQMCGRAGNIDLRNLFEARQKRFEQALSASRFCEIINMPNMETVLKGQLPVSFSDMLGQPELFYTPAEFKLHLLNLVQLLKTNGNYHLSFGHGKNDGYMLYTKEDLGVLVAKDGLPSVIFAINETNMVSAFWEFLSGEVGDLNREARRKAVGILEDLARQL